MSSTFTPSAAIASDDECLDKNGIPRADCGITKTELDQMEKERREEQ